MEEIWQKTKTKEKQEKNLKRNAQKFKYCIDYLHLGFYRKLCDHHTDFLKVFNNPILLIALYALFFYIGGFDIKINKPDDMPYFIKDYSPYIVLSLYAIAVICLAIMVFTIIKSVKNDFKEVRNLENKDNIIKSLRDLLYCFIGLALIALVVITYAPAEQKINATIQATIFFMFIIFYLWIVYSNSLILRYIILMISYIVVITIVIGINITILNPLIGKMIDNRIDLEGNLLMPTTIAYTILMLLVLFSLQKTARKNSIIPN